MWQKWRDLKRKAKGAWHHASDVVLGRFRCELIIQHKDDRRCDPPRYQNTFEQSGEYEVRDGELRIDGVAQVLPFAIDLSVHHMTFRFDGHTVCVAKSDNAIYYRYAPEWNDDHTWVEFSADSRASTIYYDNFRFSTNVVEHQDARHFGFGPKVRLTVHGLGLPPCACGCVQET